MNTLELARKIVEILGEKKGEDIILLDIHEQAIFADYFVICSGTSDRMLKGLADAVVEGVNAAFDIKPRIEGSPMSGWVLADFGDVILHLFSTDQRQYYSLDKLWSQGKVLVRLQ